MQSAPHQTDIYRSLASNDLTIMCSQLRLHCKYRCTLGASFQHNENAYKLALSQRRDKLTWCAVCTLAGISRFMHARCIYTIVCGSV